MTDDPVIHYDCRRYRGDKPCGPGMACAGCPDHDPVTERILVVKLAAVGDVLRTTPLLRALKHRFPQARITWLTDPEAAVLLRHVPLIDELLTFDPAGLLPLAVREFDWLAVLDKEPRAAALGTMIRAPRKVGFGLDSSGRLVALNPESLYALRLGLDDELKFRGNDRSYPRITLEMCGFPYQGEEYLLDLPEETREAGMRRLREAGWRPGVPSVGLNTGAGTVFATKKWTREGFATLARLLVERLGVQVVLLGGPAEEARNRSVAETAGVPVIDPGTGNPLDVFAGIIDACDVLVTADTLALHLALALGTQVVVLMGPTAPVEIELYNRGEIMTTGETCAPCYLQRCPKGAPCMTGIDPAGVFQAVSRRLGARAGHDGSA